MRDGVPQPGMPGVRAAKPGLRGSAENAPDREAQLRSIFRVSLAGGCHGELCAQLLRAVGDPGQPEPVHRSGYGPSSTQPHDTGFLIRPAGTYPLCRILIMLTLSQGNFGGIEQVRVNPG